MLPQIFCLSVLTSKTGTTARTHPHHICHRRQRVVAAVVPALQMDSQKMFQLRLNHLKRHPLMHRVILSLPILRQSIESVTVKDIECLADVKMPMVELNTSLNGMEMATLHYFKLPLWYRYFQRRNVRSYGVDVLLILKGLFNHIFVLFSLFLQFTSTVCYSILLSNLFIY